MRAIVCGAGGFIGGHLVARLREEGYYVIGLDRKYPEYNTTAANEFYLFDLTTDTAWDFIKHLGEVDEIYQLAADMGGLGFIAVEHNDVTIMANSGLINLQCAQHCANLTSHAPTPKIFFTSSSCIYPRSNQLEQNKIVITEDSAYPADCDNNYGWEKLFSERLYTALNTQLGIEVRIARLHNCYGLFETYKGGREKVPAATCRKIASIPGKSGTIKVWGDGEQIRTFMWIDDCIEGIRRLMNFPYFGPVNLGSEEMVSVNELVNIVAGIAGKKVEIEHIEGPTGVRARTSDNRLLAERLGWSPKTPLVQGISKMYKWIEERIKNEEGSSQG